MSDRDGQPAQARNYLLFASAVAWSLLLGGLVTLDHCPVVARESPQMLVNMTSPASLAMGWALMLVAMMSPALIPPVRHVWLQSFRHRRIRSIGLFVAGYAAIWMVSGVIIIALAQVLRTLPESSTPLALTSLVTLVWQFSPIKQRSLNRGHAHPVLGAFGWAADADALRFGLAHGTWCVGSCWALMLLTWIVPHGHVVTMAAMTLLVFAERLERPAEPKWGLRGPGKLMRIALAQTRMQLERG
jgi:predicted metal-binding membrane protein